MNKPPYEYTPQILSLVGSISEKIGEFNSTHLVKPSPKLRKKNRIKTIAASLNIEGNTFSEDQISDVLDGKKVVGSVKDLKEVQNAIAAYENLSDLKPGNLKSFLKAHKILMNELVEKPGQLRSKQVGIVKGNKVAHVAPQAKILPQLMGDLFEYIKNSDELPLIKSCVAHYEIEFIHPFMDGNGRMGRLWQSVILAKENDVFSYLPFETVIKDRQNKYYKVLETCDKSGSSTLFIEFMLKAVDDSLADLLNLQARPVTAKDRINIFIEKCETDSFTRKQYLAVFKDISTATASRDLKMATEQNLISKTGDKNQTVYNII